VPANGVFNPPTTYYGYWMSDYGTAGAEARNTAYLVGHSWNAGESAFNPVLDIPHSTGAVRPGDKLQVTTPEGAWSYTVTGTAVYEQAAISGQAEVWKNQPGRLVIITCFQYNDASVPLSGKNYVLYAQMDPGPATRGGKR
jgi:hypothetical protein